MQINTYDIIYVNLSSYTGNGPESHFDVDHTNSGLRPQPDPHASRHPLSLARHQCDAKMNCAS